MVEQRVRVGRDHRDHRRELAAQSSAGVAVDRHAGARCGKDLRRRELRCRRAPQRLRAAGQIAGLGAHRLGRARDGHALRHVVALHPVLVALLVQRRGLPVQPRVVPRNAIRAAHGHDRVVDLPVRHRVALVAVARLGGPTRRVAVALAVPHTVLVEESIRVLLAAVRPRLEHRRRHAREVHRHVQPRCRPRLGLALGQLFRCPRRRTQFGLSRHEQRPVGWVLRMPEVCRGQRARRGIPVHIRRVDTVGDDRDRTEQLCIEPRCEANEPLACLHVVMLVVDLPRQQRLGQHLHRAHAPRRVDCRQRVDRCLNLRAGGRDGQRGSAVAAVRNGEGATERCHTFGEHSPAPALGPAPYHGP